MIFVFGAQRQTPAAELYQVIAARASAPAATKLCFWDKVLQRGKGRSARTFVLRLRLHAIEDHARTPRVGVEGKPQVRGDNLAYVDGIARQRLGVGVVQRIDRHLVLSRRPRRSEQHLDAVLDPCGHRLERDDTGLDRVGDIARPHSHHRAADAADAHRRGEGIELGPVRGGLEKRTSPASNSAPVWASSAAAAPCT